MNQEESKSEEGLTIIMMFYRLVENKARENASHRLSRWHDMPVGEFNSEKTDGETFDLIRHYAEDPKWEVVLREITIPAEYDFLEEEATVFASITQAQNDLLGAFDLLIQQTDDVNTAGSQAFSFQFLWELLDEKRKETLELSVARKQSEENA